MIRYCARCVMPETRPDLTFDPKGVCDACRSAEAKDRIDWETRQAQLGEILDQYRSRDRGNYDCIVPSSGGKDSHFQTYVMKHLFGLNPLCVTWTPCNQTELGKRNIRNLQRMGVDYIEVTGNPHVMRKLVRLGFEVMGDCCWPEHVGIFTAPVQVALRYRVPLLVWGENPQFEYGGPTSRPHDFQLNRRWMEEFGGLRGLRVEDAMRILGLGPGELLPYLYPSEEELAAVGTRGIFLGQFIRWDARAQVDLVKQYGFGVNEEGPQEGTYVNYENLDCKYVGIHDYLMYCKYGFGRATSHACIDIRNGRLSREEAMTLVRQYDGKVSRRYLGEFLREMEMNEDEFFRVCDVFTNKTIFVTDEHGRPVRDEEGNLIKINCDNDEPEEAIERRARGGVSGVKPAPVAPVRRSADVTIVDYGMGNLRSVAKAFEALGLKAVVTDRPEDVEVAERIVLPGVGAFGAGMRQLRARGLVPVLERQVLREGVPFLGICLGMQLLGERGWESGTHEGLGWMAGEVVPIVPGDPSLKVPHIGWNDVWVRAGSRLLRGVDGSAAFYFVHGYRFAPADGGIVTGIVQYGDEMVAVVERGNLFGVQFHPEKSQRAGLAVLRNFVNA